MVAEAGPDVVLVATGAKPLVPPIPGVDRPEVVTAWDVLGGFEVGRRVLVVGGGLTGLETAELLAERGREVVVVEMLKRVGADMGGTVRWHLMNRTKDLSMKTFVSTQIREIRPGGVVVVSRNGAEETWEAFDTIVLACGVKSRDELSPQLAGDGPGGPRDRRRGQNAAGAGGHPQRQRDRAQAIDKASPIVHNVGRIMRCAKENGIIRSTW